MLGFKRLLPILAIQFIGSLGFSIVIPILVFLVMDMGGAAWTYGFVGATYSAFQLVGAPTLGKISDRVGRRWVLLVSQFGTLCAWILFLYALQQEKTELATFAGATLTVPLLLIFTARALDGLTGGNVAVANAFVADLTADNHEARQKAFGWMGIAASTGFSFGPAISGLLAETPWGYSAPVAAAAAISAIGMLLAFALPKPKKECPKGPERPKVVHHVMGHEHRHHDKRHKEHPVWENKQLRAIMFATFVLFLAFNILFAVFPVHAESHLEWDAQSLGFFFTVIAAMMVIAEGPVLGYMSSRVAPRALFAGGLMLLAGAFFTYTSGIDVVTFAGAFLFALGNGLAWPTFQARLADAAGDGNQGAVQGVASSASSLASIIGLIGGGILYVWAGQWIFLLGATLFILVALGTRIWFGPPASNAEP